jgi:hypothetical protein
VETSTLEKAVILNFDVLLPAVLEIKLINWCNRLAQQQLVSKSVLRLNSHMSRPAGGHLQAV